MQRETIIITTLVCYKLLLLGIGFWVKGRNRDNTDLFLGGRQLGPLVASISYAASNSSAWTILGVSGITYAIGVSAIWFVVGSISGHLLSWFLLSERLMCASRENNYITVLDLIAGKTTGPIRGLIVYFSGLIVVFMFILYVAAQFQGAGTTFSATFDLNITSSIILGGVVVLIYTMIGGFWAVSITDTIQGLLMAFSALVLPLAAFYAIGGWSSFLDGLVDVSTPEQLKFSSEHLGLQAVGFIFGTLSVGFGALGQPQLLTRFMALRDEAAMRKAKIYSIFWFILVFFGMYFLGLCGHILLPNLTEAEAVFFALSNHLLPPFIAAVLTAAVLSAVMSTADSQLLVSASVFAHDFGWGERKSNLIISRFIIALVSATAIAVALIFPESIFKRVLFAWQLLGAAFAPVVILRAFRVSLTGNAILASIATGFTATVFFHFQPDAPGDIAERVLPIVMSFTILWLLRSKQA